MQHQRLAKPGQSKLAEQSTFGRPPAMQSPSARYPLASRTDEQAPEVTQNLSVRSNNFQGGGQPLPEPVRGFFEPRFAHDFSRIPAHSDARAAETAYALGHQAMQKLFPTGVLQAKLKINQPGDRYEQEADRIAEQVMRMPDLVPADVSSAPLSLQGKYATCASGQGLCPKCAAEESELQRMPLAVSITPLVLRQAEGPEEEEEEEEKLLQTKSAGGGVPEVAPDLDARINALRGGGQPLPESDRAFFEPRFGADLSQVRLHTDTRAADTARALNARAFTSGQDIAFGAGQYGPENTIGKKLLAHELAHIVQQNGGNAQQVIRSMPSVKSKEWVHYTRSDSASWCAGIIQRQHQGSATAEFTKSGWEEVNELGIVYQERGANLRDIPLPAGKGSRVLENLPQNTKVFILNHNKRDRWFALSAVGEKGIGKFGYVADWLIWRKLPEPDVEVKQIKSGEYPLGIAAEKYKSHFTEWGKDLRYVVNALVYINSTAEHNGTGQSGLRKKDSDVTKKWFESKAVKDTYIWLPSSAFLKAMYKEVVEKGGGTGSITADLWHTIKKGLEVLAYGAAFVGGLVHGFVKSIYDAVVGIAEMIIDLLVSIFTLNVLKDAKELWDAVSSLTWEDIKDAVGAWADKWHAKLESDSPWVAGHAHGYLTGYVMGEAAMLLISVGSLAALKGAKWATKFAQAIKNTRAAKALAKGLDKVRKGGGKAKELLKKAKDRLSRTRVKKKILRRSEELAAKVRSETGQVGVNLGGTGEEVGFININNLSGGQKASGIPNLIEKSAEDVRKLFRPGSVDEVVANNIVPGSMDWTKVAEGSYSVLREGGSVRFAEFAGGYEKGANIKRALEAAGFKNVKIIAKTAVTGTK